ncbi:hypothetical protein ERJ75_001527900 [Trypanosoma vivax]|uniref:Transmembrane protein n=1 Tax=Trypanosoma vivax (strain Y486) TaxID=1055687 RepID=G0UB52_TRYVY|nr:hypothetical protein TRVL_07267 [Trypanosoma vivax]KAH8606205.1 hypothetical protein ERJ75_001527900 [Trypanosoma vivax]CCC53039.1 conserved hypothetical protein [Trypanosoma vivax Y486]
MHPVEGSSFRWLSATCTTIWYFTLPEDRPMPLFTIIIVIANGVQLAYGFSFLLSSECKEVKAQWSSAGLANSIVNIVYPVVLMWRTRRRIEEGIPLDRSGAHLFVSDLLNVVFLLFMVWEVVWVSHSLQAAGMSNNPDQCSYFLLFQVCFCIAIIVLGTCLIGLTFMTEFGKLARWRRWADERWRQRQQIFAMVHYGISTMPTYASHGTTGRTCNAFVDADNASGVPRSKMRTM